MKQGVLITLLLGLFFLPTTVFGYTEETTGGSLIASVFPANPEPFETVIVELDTAPQSYAGATIDWIVNESPVPTPSPANRLSVTLGDAGTITTIIAVVTRRSDLPVTKSIGINPGSVNLLVDPITYTPHGFRGAPRTTQESTVRLTALPLLREIGGNSVSPEDLQFTWRESSVVVAQGKGVNSLELEAPLTIGSKNISVTVENTSGSISAREQITLRATEPEILFYREHPSRGTLYARTLGARAIEEQEINVRAEPYYFSFGDPLDFTWTVNGEEAQPDERDSRIITLRNTSTKSIEAVVSLAITNLRSLFQESETTVVLNFGPRQFEF